jgi:hypothetical protein
VSVGMQTTTRRNDLSTTSPTQISLDVTPIGQQRMIKLPKVRCLLFLFRRSRIERLVLLHQQMMTPMPSQRQQIPRLHTFRREFRVYQGCHGTADEYKAPPSLSEPQSQINVSLVLSTLTILNSDNVIVIQHLEIFESKPPTAT